MKENEMNDSKKIEQQLLEEQLQAVTGGCGECVNDKMLAAQKLQDSFNKQYKAHYSMPRLSLPGSRSRLLRESDELQSEAENLLARVAQRQQDPNHQNHHNIQ
jgi:hypothetical protein